MQLEEAQAAGRARVLEPGASIEAEVAFALFGGLDGVSSVDADGAGFAIR